MVAARKRRWKEQVTLGEFQSATNKSVHLFREVQRPNVLRRTQAYLTLQGVANTQEDKEARAVVEQGLGQKTGRIRDSQDARSLAKQHPGPCDHEPTKPQS